MEQDLIIESQPPVRLIKRRTRKAIMPTRVSTLRQVGHQVKAVDQARHRSQDRRVSTAVNQLKARIKPSRTSVKLTKK